MSELLELRAVSKAYLRGERRLHVLEDVSLALGPGEIAAVVASRHEGRTTLLRIAAGLVRPDRGEVRFRGADLALLGDAKRSLLLAHEIAWTSALGHGGGLEVLRYMTLPLLMGSGHSQRDARTHALAALERVGAEACARQRWHELSGWEQMLVLLARATVNRPSLIVLDDVLDGFGMLRTQQAAQILRSLVEEVGCSAILSSSDLEAAVGADSVYWMEAGALKPMAGGVTDEASVIEFPLARGESRVGGIGA